MVSYANGKFIFLILMMLESVFQTITALSFYKLS
jgi:hypothetical protein